MATMVVAAPGPAPVTLAPIMAAPVTLVPIMAAPGAQLAPPQTLAAMLVWCQITLASPPPTLVQHSPTVNQVLTIRS